MRGKTDLYRHFAADGTLLYVGVSLSCVCRLIQHRKTSGWYGDIANITVEKFRTRGEAIEAERLAIRRDQPQHNKIRHAIKPSPVYHAPPCALPYNRTFAITPERQAEVNEWNGEVVHHTIPQSDIRRAIKSTRDGDRVIVMPGAVLPTHARSTLLNNGVDLVRQE